MSRSAPVLVLVLAGALANVAAAQGPPPAAVRVGTVELTSVQERRKVTGEVRSLRRGRIAAQEAGWVTELRVREGELVEAGAVLARIDAKRLELALAEEQADIARLAALLEERNADVERAERDVESLRRLSERGATNPKVLSDADSDRRVAIARLRQIEGEQAVAAARVALLDERLGDAVIRAPWGGRVIVRATEVGQWLDVGDAVVEMISSRELEAWVLVPQRYWGALDQEGTRIEIHVDATAATFQVGALRSIPLVDARARNFQVIAEIDAAAMERGSIAPGMSVTAWVPTGEKRERLLVPRDAILRNDVGSYVYVAQPGAEGAPATAMFTPIEVAFSIGTRAVVESPALTPGALVVTEGNERLFPMAPVIPLPLDAPRAPDAPGTQDAQDAPDADEVPSR